MNDIEARAQARVNAMTDAEVDVRFEELKPLFMPFSLEGGKTPPETDIETMYEFRALKKRLGFS